MAPRLLTLVAVALAPSHALVAHAPAMRPMAAVAPAGRAPASPTMLLGSRTFTKMIRSARLPSSFGPTGGRGGIIRGSDGGEGGPPPSDGASASSSDDDSSQSALTQAWKRYESLLDEKPLLMKALTSLVGFALGDTLAQLFIQKTDPFDFARLARLASFGFLVHGTTSHWFYGMLDGKIPGKSAKVLHARAEAHTRGTHRPSSAHALTARAAQAVPKHMRALRTRVG